MPAVRQQSSWVISCAAAVAIAAVVVAVHRQPIALAAPPDSPGLSEWIAIAIARVAHAAPMAAWMSRANVAMSAVAVALFLVLARRRGVRWLAAMPVALAFALSSPFDPVLSPFRSAGLALAAAAFLAIDAAVRDEGRGPRWAAWIALAAAALVEPRMAGVLAVLAGAIVARSRGSAGPTRRFLAGAAAAATLVLLVVLLERLMPQLPPPLDAAASAHSLAQRLTDWWRNGRDAVSRVFTIAGPLASALAVFGAFVHRAAVRDRSTGWLLIYAMVPLAVAGATGASADESRWLAPALVGFWVLVAMGLNEIIRGTETGVKGRALAVVFVALLPMVKLARPPAIPAPEFTPRGHDRVTLDDAKRLVAWLPDGAVVVHADAIGDLLLRALDGTWQRMGKSLAAETPESPGLRQAVESDRVAIFALPAAQVELPKLGLQLEDVGAGGPAGLARVRAGGACTTMDADWREAPALRSTATFSLVAQDPRWDGPLVFYAESAHRLDAAPIDWPGTTSRGFGGRPYSRRVPSDRALLDEALAADGYPAGPVSFEQDDVVRLELWHPPEAPRILVVALSDRPTRVIARIGSPAAPQRMTICPVFVFAARGF